MEANKAVSSQKEFVEIVEGVFNMILVKNDEPSPQVEKDEPSPQVEFALLVDKAFSLILNNKEGNLAATQQLHPVSRRAPIVPPDPACGAAPDHDPLPSAFHGGSSDGRKLTGLIAKDKYEKAISDCSTLDDQMFQSLNHDQLAMIRPLYEIFRDIIPDELELFSKIVLDRVKNKAALQYAFWLAMSRRLLAFPAHITVEPNKYFEMDNVEYERGEDAGSIMIKPKFHYHGDTNDDLTARTEYFRLDPGINAHHRHWHEVNMDMPGQPDQFISTERVYRGGELFYYMHSQMVARYNFERLSVGLGITEPHSDFDGPMLEGHCDRLTATSGAKLYGSRPPNTTMKDIKTNQGRSIGISALKLARDRLYETIDERKVVNDGPVQADWKDLNPLNPPIDYWTVQDLTLDYGVDRLGDMIWAYQARSLNLKHYGNLHNDGHLVIAYSHNPDGCYQRLSEPGVMASNETAVRDPMFFAWHTFIDDIFQRYKATLPPYDAKRQLEFRNISIDKLDLEQSGVAAQDSLPVLETKWFLDRVDITTGMDCIDPARRQSLKADKIWHQFIHLGHDEFKYKFTITNLWGRTKLGTVRIFMAPYYGADVPKFNKFRRMFIELDKFVVRMKNGQNTYDWSSKKSSLTVPIEKLFLTWEQALALNIDPTTQGGTAGENAYEWCRCGWPDYFLIGKGNREGLKCCLFLMVTDYDQDKVDYASENKCVGSEIGMSYCGRRNKRYPDRKTMGFPFDRNVKDETMSLEGFMTKTRNGNEPAPEIISNMKKIDFYVKHVGKVEQPEMGPTMMPSTKSCSGQPC